MVESSSPTNSTLKTMLGIGTASILSFGLMPNYTPKLPTYDKIYSYECTSENPCDYFLKNEVMPKVLIKLNAGPDVETIHSFINDLVENSEKSPPHFSKTVDKYFWDLA